MKILPEPLVQLCNIRLFSPTWHSSSLAHCGKRERWLCIHLHLYILNKSQLMLGFLSCTNHYFITFDKLLKANLLQGRDNMEGCKVAAVAITQITEGWKTAELKSGRLDERFICFLIC